MATARSPERGLFILLLALAVAVFAVHTWQYGGYIADDAAITFAYAKNLARGEGLVLNPGTDPVEGYSNFGWLLVVLPFCARGQDPTIPIKVLSFVLGSITLVLVGLVGRRLQAESGAHSWTWALAAVGLASFAPFTVWASAGMENVLYCGLFVAATYFYLRRWFSTCAVALVGLSLTRIEGVALAGLFIAHRTASMLVARSRPQPRDIRALFTFAGAYTAYVVWHWLYFRALVPNTYLAKSPTLRTGSLTNLVSTFQPGWEYAYTQLIGPYHFLIVLPAVILGLIVLERSAMAIIALLLAGVSLLVLLTGGDFYPQFRLGTVFLPLWFLLLTSGTRALLSRVRARSLAVVLGLIPIAIVCQPSIAVARSWGLGPISVGLLKPITADRFTQIASFMTKRPLTVMESDIGNVAYFTDFAIVDLGGLANLAIARHGFDPTTFLPYVFNEVKPDIIHLRDTWAANAGIPIPLMERKYHRLEGRLTGPYADGWWVRRDPDHPYGSGQMRDVGEDGHGTRTYADVFDDKWTQDSAGRWKQVEIQPESLAPTGDASGAAEVFATVRRECDDDVARCHRDVELSRVAQARADALRRAGQMAEAFEWYAAAWEADRRNVVALRRREDARLPDLRGCFAPPAQPRAIRIAVTGSTATVAWDATIQKGTSFLVEAGSSSGASDQATFETETTTLTVPNAKKGTYYVRVRARNACGASPPSDEFVTVIR